MLKTSIALGLTRSGILSKLIFTLVSILLIVSLLFACSTPVTNSTVSQPTMSTAPTLTPQYGGVLRIVPRSIEHAFGYTSDMLKIGAVDISYPCVESLCGVNFQGEFLPELATTAQFAPDGKSVTFNLRNGVKFHDGTDFNAQAAKWNLDIAKKARIPGTDTWFSIDVVDSSNVRINLKKYQNSIFGDLAISSGRMVSPTAVEQNSVEWAHTHPVGTGPFKFMSYTPDVGITYERFDDYWGGKPYLDEIEVIFIADDMAKSAALQSGAVDMLFNVDSETAIALRSKGYNVGNGPQERVTCMFPDSANKDSPLSNQLVRQAIEYAIDRDALANLGNGFWLATNQISTPTTVGYITDFEGRKYNQEKAKQLLEQASYINGFNIKVFFTPSNTPQDTMVAIQQFLSKIGITVDLQSLQAPEKSSLDKSGWQNGCVIGSMYTGSTFVSAMSRNLEPTGESIYVSTARPQGWSDALTQVNGVADPTTFESLSRKLVTTTFDDATIIPLWAMPQVIFVQQNYVHDSGIWEEGSTFSWAPEKTWLSK